MVTALGRAVQQEGHDVEVVIPKYDCIDYGQVEDLVLDREFMWDGIQVKVWKGVVEELPTTFLEPCNGIVWMGSIYTNMNGDRNRFGTSSAGAPCTTCSRSRRGAGRRLLHCHDWQSAPIAFMDRQGIPAAFTIHNMDFGADLISGAVERAEVSTTVSPTYAVEISGHPGISPHLHKFYGIRNGIDVDIWDPSSDAHAARSTTRSTTSRRGRRRPSGRCSEAHEPGGRRRADRGLRDQADGPEGHPPHQARGLEGHGARRPVRAARLCPGPGHPGRLQPAGRGPQDAVSRIVPGCWFRVRRAPLPPDLSPAATCSSMPSMFEPCGLTQMIAMRFGTVPVVRRTGGSGRHGHGLRRRRAEKAESLGLEVNGFSFDGSDAGWHRLRAEPGVQPVLLGPRGVERTLAQAWHV